MKDKIKVAVIYGGESGEHEVSLQSAFAVVKNLDRNRFDIFPISIDKSGHWRFNDLQTMNLNQGNSLPVPSTSPEVKLGRRDGKVAIISLSSEEKVTQPIDVVFPVMHGPLCEDGAIQGLLEMNHIPYVGSKILGSAIGMDKDVAKRLAGLAGISIAPFLVARSSFEYSTFLAECKDKLSLPVFVKPANLGSSLGITKVKEWPQLERSVKEAFKHDRKVMVEQGVDAREIEVAVLDGHPLLTSLASEIIPNPKHEFYSYEAKYLDAEGAKVDLPAKISPEQMKEVQKMAADAFRALECEGMARVDFFLDRKTNKFYFNEVNTLPGFTSISMYPKMMAASGVPYSELLSRLIDLALKSRGEKT